MKGILRRAAAIAFIVFLSWVIVIADRGEGGRWWSFIGSAVVIGVSLLLLVWRGLTLGI